MQIFHALTDGLLAFVTLSLGARLLDRDHPLATFGLLSIGLAAVVGVLEFLGLGFEVLHEELTLIAGMLGMLLIGLAWWVRAQPDRRTIANQIGIGAAVVTLLLRIAEVDGSTVLGGVGMALVFISALTVRGVGRFLGMAGAGLVLLAGLVIADADCSFLFIDAVDWFHLTLTAACGLLATGLTLDE